jgi:hypothetical protein
LSTRAELIFQPKKGPSDKQWREAGSELFNAMAKIFDGLAAAEQKNTPALRTNMESALKSLEIATHIYQGLAESITSKDKISIERVENGEKKRIQDAFEFYHATLPQDERGAAKIAAEESKRFGNSLQSLKKRIEQSEIGAVQEVLVAITRVGHLGTSTARLLELTAEVKQ